jgi:molecular chaperone HtpG
MEVERSQPLLDDEGKPVEGADPVITTEIETLNSMKAIWARPESEVEEDEYKEFYKHISHDWTDPFSRIVTKLEGTFEASLLLFLPAKAPFDLHFREAKRGIHLYVRRVFIMDDCKDLVPEYLRFIRGVVDAEDLSLNVSREMLQQDRQVKAIRKFLVKKVLDNLKALQNQNFEKYLEFWTEFGAVIKEGLLDSSEKHDRILDLILAESTASEGKLSTLSDIVDRMDEDQDKIYYITAPSREAAAGSPHLEVFEKKGIEVLFLTDRVDEVWVERARPTFMGKTFQSVVGENLELGSESEREEEEAKRVEQEKDFKDLLGCLQSHLDEDVKEVKLSSRLTDSPACLVSSYGEIPPQMAAAMRQAGQDVPKSKAVMEINAEHPVLVKLQDVFHENKEDDRLAQGAQLIYGQAVLAAGGELSDPAGFSKQVADLMLKAF